MVLGPLGDLRGPHPSGVWIETGEGALHPFYGGYRLRNSRLDGLPQDVSHGGRRRRKLQPSGSSDPLQALRCAAGKLRWIRCPMVFVHDSLQHGARLRQGGAGGLCGNVRATVRSKYGCALCLLLQGGRAGRIVPPQQVSRLRRATELHYRRDVRCESLWIDLESHRQSIYGGGRVGRGEGLGNAPVEQRDLSLMEELALGIERGRRRRGASHRANQEDCAHRGESGVRSTMAAERSSHGSDGWAPASCARRAGRSSRRSVRRSLTKGRGRWAWAGSCPFHWLIR